MKLSWISKYRSALMGLATILVMIFHGLDIYSYYNKELPILSRIIKGFFGSVGVDIFLLLSGIGIFYSLRNNTDIFEFYKRRLARIGPSILIICGIFWAVKDICIEKRNWGIYLLDLSGLSFWLQGENRFWYIYLIIVLYILSPFILKLGEKQKLILLAAVTFFPILMELSGSLFFKNCEIALCRIPIYLCGIIGGGLAVKNKKELSLEFIL